MAQITAETLVLFQIGEQRSKTQGEMTMRPPVILSSLGLDC